MPRPTRILHCFRAPVGGLFRHVCDLARGQAAAGYEVGLLCDATTGGDTARDTLQTIEHDCALGIHRIPMARLASPADIAATRHLSGLAGYLSADILHGHGAKGGAYARMAIPRNRPISVYTPHGGSLHYRRTSPVGLFFLSLERILAYRTNGLIFESAYSRDVFAAKVAEPRCPARVIPNGLRPEEFAPVPLTSDPTDFLFVGELRKLKGVDILLEALGEMNRNGTPATATIVGSGPDEDSFKALADALGLHNTVRFAGAMPARAAFAMARTLVVPSRAESFPYIVLEAAAARKPIIATRVGGIPEIYGPDADRLVAPDSAASLRAALEIAMGDGSTTAHDAERLADRVSSQFTVENMVTSVNTFYGEILHRRSDPVSQHSRTPTPAE